MDLHTIRTWADSAQRTALDDGAAVEAWHTLSHRNRFIKTLPSNGTVLDVGAGDGGLQVYRNWPSPKRSDLSMFAFAMTRGAQFDQYERYELGSWPETQPVFDGIAFDAIVAVNFIEHIEGPITFIRWAASRLSQRGRMYLEWPTPRPIEMPSADELRTFGIDVMAGNYFDDATHRDELPATAAVHDALHASGLTVEEAGIARVPFFEDHIWHIGKTKNDLVARTMAYWSFTNWCQYVIARR